METRVEIDLPVDVEEAWEVLADTPRMVAIDPLLVEYRPENGVLQEGTLNHVVSRVGPFRVRMVTKTVALEPPHRAVFASWSPAKPVSAVVEDRLIPTFDGSHYSVTISVKPTSPLGAPLAPLMARMMARYRRRFARALRELLLEPPTVAG